MKKKKEYNEDLIREVLSEITEEELGKAELKMALSVKIMNAIEARDMNKSEFAKSLNKSPSEISKWLSGTHNFTVETLYEIEQALNINLIDREVKSRTIVEMEPMFFRTKSYPEEVPGITMVSGGVQTGKQSLYGTLDDYFNA